MLASFLAACTITVTGGPPRPDTGSTTPPATGPVDVVLREPFELGADALRPRTDPTLHFVGAELYAVWLAGDEVQGGEVPLADPSVMVPLQLGLGARGRPDIGTAQDRLVASWDDGRGTLRVAGVLANGDPMDALVLATDAEPGTARLGLAADGAGEVVYAAAGAVTVAAFDRLLVTAEAPEVLADPLTGALDAVPAPDGGFVVAWLEPDLVWAELPGGPAETMATGALADPAIASVDGRAGVAWVDSADGLHARWADATELGTPIDVSTGAADPAIVWAGDLLVVVWVAEGSLLLAVVTPSGEITEPVTLGAGSSPTATVREVNGGHEVAVGWIDGDALWARTALVLPNDER